jgi:glycosyltransferase involved in cell wall biosynthesis
VSVVTASLNASVTIRSAIESVLRQDYPNIEYIVVDGGSTDDTLTIVNEYQSRISSVTSELDRGIADAFNKGVRLAHGEFIGFLNTDDVYLPGAISLLVQQFRNTTPSPDIAYGDAVCLADGAAPYVVVALGPHEATTLTPFICHQAMLARRTLFPQVGEFNEGLRFGMDYDWILRCMRNGARVAAFSGHPVVHYSAQGTSGRNPLKALLEFRRIALANSLGVVRVNAYYSLKLGMALLQEGLYRGGLKKTVLAAKTRLKSKYRPLPLIR